MKSTQWEIRVGVRVLVTCLCLLVLLSSGAAWYMLTESASALQGPAADAANQRLDQAVWVFAVISVLAIILAFMSLRMVSRNALRPMEVIGRQLDALAGGDLTYRVDARPEELGGLAQLLKRVQDSLARSVGNVRAGLDLIGDSAQRIISGHTDLSSRTEQQAAALQQTAASMEELSSTVKQNADNALQANQLAVTASEVAQRGGTAVGEVVSTMQGISASSRKISDIVGVIDSIAFQTNILALNAAVEAARAGEQGKGFAVVASEVRALAQRSAHAAKEIKDLIEDSVKKVAEGSEQVERAGSTMEEIVTSVARVTDIMGEISAATVEQSSGIEQINRAINQMDGVTQQNAVLVEEAARAAEELRRHIGQVGQAVSTFRLASGHRVIDVSPKADDRRTAKPAKVAAPARPPLASPSSEDSGSKPAIRPVAASAGTPAKPAPALAPAPVATNTKSVDDDWEEF
ncbi:MAG TPA: methyl-accepting chemotaxis protein [Pusillimonas sp.]|uniref:methyl-accepting chemotaxis protein n=2 Tax=unclassified Pusillimonas TaxID=2640016 RepID=UPI002B4B9348|nr:methyl-accepting chemotaxis protein [Pusillimonas sp.]HLU18546.1 methyl-accepting chemotaxis protein [Pusillimonas sp.]